MEEGKGSVLSKVGESNLNHAIEVHCKVYFIVDDGSAAEYAELLTQIKNNDHYQLVESESAWNQDGEMTKIITYEIKNKVRK